MSADNWTLCPKCVSEAQAAKAQQRAEAEAAYGELPIAMFEEMRAEAQLPLDLDPFRTFREDYEFSGASDGTIFVSYKGYCQRVGCNCGIEFKDERQFWQASA